MDKNINSLVSEVRSFSRFYTNILGLLNQGILDSPYSLTEVRILLEIDRNEGCTANTITEKLDVDRGYMSRILSRFDADGLISRVSSSTDGRMVLLYLTQRGKETLSVLEEKSNIQIKKLISHLTENDQEKLIESLRYVTSTLSSAINPVIIRTFEPKDVDYIIKRHRELYEDEYGFSTEFGDYVEKYVLKFNEHHDEDKENMWIAEEGGKAVGVIAIIKVDDSTAQLRWFLIEPNMRGKGLGHKLMRTVIDFCKEKNYKHVLLWTVNILESARHLYKSYGFDLTETVENKTWTGSLIYEERWDLYL